MEGADERFSLTSMSMRKLDFDALYDEAEAADRVGICPHCQVAADEDGERVQLHVLCWCGVCFKYHHDDYMHETMIHSDEERQ